jgi:hypothetical protein
MRKRFIIDCETTDFTGEDIENILNINFTSGFILVDEYEVEDDTV